MRSLVANVLCFIFVGFFPNIRAENLAPASDLLTWATIVVSVQVYKETIYLKFIAKVALACCLFCFLGVFNVFRLCIVF